MESNKLNCVILAAGEGKRMFSKNSKVLCEVTHKPMLLWVTDAAKSAGIQEICIVVSNKDVEKAVSNEKFNICYQNERLGTGHAVLCAKDFLNSLSDGDTLILYGDAPFIDKETITKSFLQHKHDDNAVTVITASIDNPKGYGRIVRTGGKLSSIVEDLDCDDVTATIKEINSGCCWFKTSELLSALSLIKNDNKKGEYYLTDAVKILISGGKNAGCYLSETSDVTLGANNPVDLLNLNDMASERAIMKHLMNGVHFVKKDGIIIGPDVEIGAGATILPNTAIYGRCKIGKGAVVGPNSVVNNTDIGEGSTFNASQSNQAKVGAGVSIGPFVQLRPGTVVEDDVKIGDFVEIKNSTIGKGTSVAHLTYIGDTDVGKHCNFGCGVVTVNYDGENKHRSTVKDFAFVGCNTNIIAPSVIGEAAYTAAGVTVSGEVPDGSLAIDRGKMVIKENWASRKLEKYIEKKKKK